MSVATYRSFEGAGAATLQRLNLPHYAILALVIALVVTPIAFLVLGSFSSAKLLGEISLTGLTLENYHVVWTDPALPAIIRNTAVYAIGSTGFGVCTAI